MKQLFAIAIVLAVWLLCLTPIDANPPHLRARVVTQQIVQPHVPTMRVQAYVQPVQRVVQQYAIQQQVECVQQVVQPVQYVQAVYAQPIIQQVRSVQYAPVIQQVQYAQQVQVQQVLQVRQQINVRQRSRQGLFSRIFSPRAQTIRTRTVIR